MRKNCKNASSETLKIRRKLGQRRLEKQAEEAIEKSEHNRVMYMQKKLTDLEDIEAEHTELIRLCQEQLDVTHAANEEDVCRLKAEHAAFRQQFEQEAAQGGPQIAPR